MTAAGDVYVADTGNHVIRRIAAVGGLITTVVGTASSTGFSGDGGSATAAKLSSPTGVYVDANGDIYVADTGNHRVRWVDVSADTITTFAGTGVAGFSGDVGPATEARLNRPAAVFGSGASVTESSIYIADTDNHRIRRVDLADGEITTFAGTTLPGFSGDGDLPGTAQLAFPRALHADGVGNVYVADRFNHRVRRANVSGNMVTLVADGSLSFGGDGAGANLAQVASPTGVFVDASGTIFIADSGNHRVRSIAADETAALSGASIVGPTGEVQILRVAFTGDDDTGVNAVTLTVSDLGAPTTANTGLVSGDFTEFRLYQSADSFLDGADNLLGKLSSQDFTVGTAFTFKRVRYRRPAWASDVTTWSRPSSPLQQWRATPSKSVSLPAI